MTESVNQKFSAVDKVVEEQFEKMVTRKVLMKNVKHGYKRSQNTL